MQTKSLSPSAWRRLLDGHPDLPPHTRRALERGLTTFIAKGVRCRLAGSFAELNAKPDATSESKLKASARTSSAAKPKAAESASLRVARAAAAVPDDDTTRQTQNSLRLVANAPKPEPRQQPKQTAAERVARRAAEQDDTLPPAA